MKSKYYQKSNLFSLFIFGLFFIFIFLQYSNVYIMFDDFGYASMTYPNYFKSLDSPFLYRLFAFLYSHYMNWGGRILYILVEVLLLQGPLWVIRLFFAVNITFLMFSIFSVGSEKNWKFAAFTCFLYGCFTVDIVNEGMYWFGERFVRNDTYRFKKENSQAYGCCTCNVTYVIRMW